MNKKERSWILYDWANSAYSIIITTAILPIYFKDVVTKGMPNYLSTGYWSTAVTISTAIVAVLSPLLGTFADYKKLKKRFLFLFFIIGIVFTALLFTVTEGEWEKCLILYILSWVGFAGANIFYDSFLVDITCKEKMDWVSASGYAWGYIGSTIPFLLCILMILKPSFFFMDFLTATRLSFIVTALWWGIFSIPLFKNCKQVYYIEPKKHSIRDSFKRIFDTLNDIKKNKNIFLFILAYFFYIDGVNTIIHLAGVYGRDIGVSKENLIIILLVVQVISFPFALLYGKLSKKISAKRMLLIGIIVYTTITFFAYFMKTTTHYWILAIMVATSMGGIQALSRSFFGKLIPKNRSAEYFGFYNIFGKFAAILGPFLVGFFTFGAKDSRTGILSLVILFITGGILLLKVKESG